MYTQCYINKKCVKSIFCLPIIILSFQLEWCGVISIRLWLFFPLLRFILFIIDRKTIENEIESHYTSSLSLSVRSQVQQHRCVQYYFSEDGHTQIERELQTLKYISHFWFEPQVFSATYTHRRLQHIRNFCGAIWWKGRALHKRFNWLESHTKASNQRRMLKKKNWKTGALSYYRKTVRHRKTQDCNSVHSVFRKRLYSTHTHTKRKRKENQRERDKAHTERHMYLECLQFRGDSRSSFQFITLHA